MTLRLNDGTECILLVHTQAGYRQLMRVSSQVMTGKVDALDAIGYLSGLVVVTTANGRLMAALTAGDGNSAWALVTTLQSHHRPGVGGRTSRRTRNRFARVRPSAPLGRGGAR